MSAVLSGQVEDRSRPLAGTEANDRRAELHRRASQVIPVPGETAAAFAARLSARIAAVDSPDFSSRLLAQATKAADAGRRLRILSIGTGSGVAEVMLLRSCEAPVELVLTGDDEDALSADVAAFDPRHHVSYRVVDLESGLARWKERFDVVFSHATLSRIVRLEPLLEDIARLLAADGELWVSREEIGTAARHGERLLQWLHHHFSPVEEHGSSGIPPLAHAGEFDLARQAVITQLRAAAVEEALLSETGRPAPRLDGIYAIRSRH